METEEPVAPATTPPASTPVDAGESTPAPTVTLTPTPAPTVTVTAVPVDSGPQTVVIDQGQFDAFVLVGVLVAIVVGFTLVTKR